jgi:cell division protein YceG involved in septum cleavage
MDMTQKLAIVLEGRQWNDVLDALHNAPFRQAAPIIQEVIKQFQDAEMKATMAQRESGEGVLIPPTANGAAHAS